MDNPKVAKFTPAQVTEVGVLHLDALRALDEELASDTVTPFDIECFNATYELPVAENEYKFAQIVSDQLAEITATDDISQRKHLYSDLLAFTTYYVPPRYDDTNRSFTEANVVIDEIKKISDVTVDVRKVELLEGLKSFDDVSDEVIEFLDTMTPSLVARIATTLEDKLLTRDYKKLYASMAEPNIDLLVRARINMSQVEIERSLRGFYEVNRNLFHTAALAYASLDGVDIL